MRTAGLALDEADIKTKDQAELRVCAIWNYPGLKDLPSADQERLCEELQRIAQKWGVGGEPVFREMLQEINRQKGL